MPYIGDEWYSPSAYEGWLRQRVAKLETKILQQLAQDIADDPIHGDLSLEEARERLPRPEA